MSRTVLALSLTVAFAASFAASAARADVVPASEQQVAWFVGKWAVGPVEAAGVTTGAGDCAQPVEIQRIGDATIRRIVAKNGAIQEADFDVMSFNGNFPWWVAGDIGGPVAKVTGENSFVLAATQNGRADWDNGLLHKRCDG